MRAASWVLIALVGCSKGYIPDTTDTDETDVEGDTDTDTDTDTDADTDTDVPETDADRDGWSVEDGDCDDSDIWINPGWDEQLDDDKDNDCDGRTDESFAGIRVFEYDEPSSHIHFIDNLGELDPDGSRIDLPGAYAFSEMVDALDGDGWVLLNSAGVVVHVDADGDMSILWDDTTTEYEEGEAPFWYAGLAAHPAGYYLVGGADRVWRIDPDGTSAVADQWDCYEDPDGATDICATTLTVDPQLEMAGLLGYFGGFSTWTAEGGLSIQVPDDPNADAPPYLNGSIASRDAGGLYMFGSSVDVEALAIKDTGFFKWDPEKGEWQFRVAWGPGGSENYTAADFVVDDETGDFYVSTNGGWERAAWRVTSDGTTYADLYRSAQESPTPDFGPLTVVWDQD